MADPSGGGENVMSLGLSSRHELLSHAHWKRKICEVTAMQMAELSPSDTELDASVAVRRDGHALPGTDFPFDLCEDRVGHSRSMDHLAFVLFVAIFCGGLATVPIGMIGIAIALFWRNRGSSE
jgi:hypothetical protein